MGDALDPYLDGFDHITGEPLVPAIDDAMSFNAALWAQLSLPYRDPDRGRDEPVRGWARTNGSQQLIVTPGTEVNAAGEVVSVGVPFGVLPRSLLIFLATEVKRTESPAIEVGASLRGFLRNLGIKYGGKTAKLVQDQMRRLFKATIQVTDVHETATQRDERFGNLLIAEAGAFTLWRDRGEGERHDGIVMLSDAYFERCMESSVPLSTEMIRHLGNAQAIDLYTWLTYRLNGIRREQTVTWEMLSRQFGGEYNRLRDFRRSTLRHLGAIREVWTDLDVEPTKEGLRFSGRGRAHINPRRGAANGITSSRST